MATPSKETKIALGLDHGTSSVKATLVSDSLEIIKEFESLEIRTSQVGADIFEQDPIQHLLHSKRLIAETVGFSISNGFDLSAIGLCVQRSGSTAWDKTTGAVLHPLIIWRDTRTEGFINSLSEQQKQTVSAATSLPVLPYYAAGKISHLQRNFADPETLIGTLDSFLIHQLCRERPFQTEPSMAARTMLYNLSATGWDESLCEIFQVKKNRLASVRPSLGKIGTIGSVPLSASLGDQQAALFAYQQDFTQPVLNLGTIASLIVPTGTNPIEEQGFITSVMFSQKNETQYILEGISHASGEVIDYIETQLGINKLDIDAACREAANSSFSWFWSAGGYATPLWDTAPASNPSSDTASNGEKAKALVENIAGFLAEIIEKLITNDILSPNQEILCTGGLSQLNYLLGYLSEITGCEFCQVETKNAGAFGAAKAALKGVGGEVIKSHQTTARFSAKNSPSSQANCAFFRWKKLRDEAL